MQWWKEDCSEENVQALRETVYGVRVNTFVVSLWKVACTPLPQWFQQHGAPPYTLRAPQDNSYNHSSLDLSSSFMKILSGLPILQI